jgi:hypothetical protein
MGKGRNISETTALVSNDPYQAAIAREKRGWGRNATFIICEAQLRLPSLTESTKLSKPCD